MTQMQTPFVEGAGEGMPEGQPQTSRLAIISLIFSIAFCCPCTTVPALIMGVIAVITIGGNPMLKGRGLALAAIIISIVGLGSNVMTWRSMQDAIGIPTEVGPYDALSAAAAGDNAPFREWFYGDAGAASDEEITAFMQELASRYGTLQSTRFDELEFQTRIANDMQSMMGAVKAMPYILTFDSGDVKADIMLATMQDPADGSFMWGVKFGTMTIFDDERGDLTFPPSATPLGSSAPTSGGSHDDTASGDDAAEAPGETEESTPDPG